MMIDNESGSARPSRSYSKGRPRPGIYVDEVLLVGGDGGTCASGEGVMEGAADGDADTRNDERGGQGERRTASISGGCRWGSYKREWGKSRRDEW